MDYKHKYLKYKQKYLLLKQQNQVGGLNSLMKLFEKSIKIKGAVKENYQDKGITEVILEDVINIPNNAFYKNSINSLVMSDSITFIGSSAFENNKLKEITLPKNIQKIGNGAFYNNPIKIVKIPKEAVEAFNKFNKSAIFENYDSITFVKI